MNRIDANGEKQMGEDRGSDKVSGKVSWRIGTPGLEPLQRYSRYKLDFTELISGSEPLQKPLQAVTRAVTRAVTNQTVDGWMNGFLDCWVAGLTTDDELQAGAARQIGES